MPTGSSGPAGKPVPPMIDGGGDGTGSMSQKEVDPGRDVERLDIGSTVPGPRHAKDPL